jgi:hypothetical protein
MPEEITTSIFHTTLSTRVLPSRVEAVYAGSEYSSTLPNPRNLARGLSSSTSTSISNPFEGEEYVLNAHSGHVRHEEQSVYSSSSGDCAQPRDEGKAVEIKDEGKPVEPRHEGKPVEPGNEEQPAPTRQETEDPPVTDLIVRSIVYPFLQT